MSWKHWLLRRVSALSCLPQKRNTDSEMVKVYSDIDTTSLIPIEDWVPSAYVNKVNLVVGVEYDKLDGGDGETSPLTCNSARGRSWPSLGTC